MLNSVGILEDTLVGNSNTSMDPSSEGERESEKGDLP